MMTPTQTSSMILVLALAGLGQGCGSRSKSSTTTPSAAASVSGTVEARTPRPVATKPPGDGVARATPDPTPSGADTGADAQAALWAPIYFEFDSPALGSEAREQLARIAAWMQAHPTLAVLIHGHADERGTEEYNLVLGDQRARAVLDFINHAGIARSRLSTLSWGETKPAVSGAEELAWARNRRCEFEPRQAPMAAR